MHLAHPSDKLTAPPEAARDLTAERDRLVAAARLFAEASLAASTRRKYREAFEDFSLWCHDHGAAPLPAEPETICLYLSDLAVRGLAASTIQLRLSALSLAHRTARSLR